MTDVATDTTAPASNGEAVAAAEERAPRSNPKRVGKVTEIPTSSRKGYWATEVEEFKRNPGESYQYDNVSQTTASYLKQTYGLVATTRNNREGRATLYVAFPGRKPNDAEVKAFAAEGREAPAMVPDEAKAKEIIASFDKPDETPAPAAQTPKNKAPK